MRRTASPRSQWRLTRRHHPHGCASSCAGRNVANANRPSGSGAPVSQCAATIRRSGSPAADRRSDRCHRPRDHVAVRAPAAAAGGAPRRWRCVAQPARAARRRSDRAPRSTTSRTARSCLASPPPDDATGPRASQRARAAPRRRRAAPRTSRRAHTRGERRSTSIGLERCATGTIRCDSCLTAARARQHATRRTTPRIGGPVHASFERADRPYPHRRGRRRGRGARRPAPGHGVGRPFIGRCSARRPPAATCRRGPHVHTTNGPSGFTTRNTCGTDDGVIGLGLGSSARFSGQYARATLPAPRNLSFYGMTITHRTFTKLPVADQVDAGATPAWKWSTDERGDGQLVAVRECLIVTSCLADRVEHDHRDRLPVLHLPARDHVGGGVHRHRELGVRGHRRAVHRVYGELQRINVGLEDQSSPAGTVRPAELPAAIPRTALLPLSIAATDVAAACSTPRPRSAGCRPSRVASRRVQ